MILTASNQADQHSKVGAGGDENLVIKFMWPKFELTIRIKALYTKHTQKGFAKYVTAQLRFSWVTVLTSR